MPFYFWVILFLLSGCSSLPLQNEVEVSDLIVQRYQKTVEWQKNGECFVDQALKEELNADLAIQVGLLNNPQIQVIFEELGIAYADVVEAGLFSNPLFELEIRYPNEKHLHTNIEYLLVTSLIDILLRPKKIQLAEWEYEKTKLRVTNEILKIAFEIRESFYETVALQHIYRKSKEIDDLIHISAELANEQFIVGNISTLEYQQAQIKGFESSISLHLNEVELNKSYQNLKRLLGITEAICLTLPDHLPEPSCINFSLCDLENLALNQRLDFQLILYELSLFQYRLDLKSPWIYTDLQIGIAGEKEPDGAHLLGPGFSGQIPIFNYGQADRIRIMSEWRKKQNETEVLKIKILSEVREAYHTLSKYQQILIDSHSLLLNQKDVLATSLSQFQIMGIGINTLLENKLNEKEQNMQFLKLQKSYWMALVNLDRALGGFLPLYGENICP